MTDDQRTVLVVDDEPSLRLLARINLELEGFAVREATSSEEAIAILETYEPDVMLLDIRMAGVHGWGVVDWLERRDRLHRSSVIILSGDTNAEMIELARRKGLHYIEKPFKIEQLTQAVAELAR